MYITGTFAEQFVTPAECLTVIRKPEIQSMACWSTLIWFSIAYGALVRGELQAGQVLRLTIDAWQFTADPYLLHVKCLLSRSCQCTFLPGSIEAAVCCCIALRHSFQMAPLLIGRLPILTSPPKYSPCRRFIMLLCFSALDKSGSHGLSQAADACLNACLIPLCIYRLWPSLGRLGALVAVQSFWH